MTTAERTIVITGGASGIGLALANCFSSLGDHVVIADRNEPAAQEVASQIRQSGGRATAISLDVSDIASIDACAAALRSLDLPCHVLINNAGIEGSGSGASVDAYQNWKSVMAVNLDGVALLTYALRPQLAAARGCVINTASIQSFAVLHTANTAYTVSKGAVAQLTKALAVELAPQNIRVNAVAPGVVETPMTMQSGRDSDRYRLFLDRIPMKRFAKPEELTGAYVFLASSAAAYVTGTVIPVDGGFLAV